MGKRVTSSVNRKKKKQKSVADTLLEEMYTILITLYFFVIFVVMPLYIYDHYYEMAFYKWKIYLFATLLLLVGLLSLGILYCTAMIAGNKNRKREINQESYFCLIKRHISTTDVFALLYGVSVVITLITCGYPRAAWLGTDSWYMGTLAQLLFVTTFLVFSGVKAPVKDVIWMNIFASGICFVIGIAQRFNWDFLHLYYGMTDVVKRDYLSTIGNRTWYSGYISVVFPLGIYLFWYSEKQIAIWLSGAYSFFAFSAIITNNSDSIYVAVAVVLLAMLVMSIGSLQKLFRWMCILVIWFMACGTMAVLKIYFPDDTRQLRGISRFFLDIRHAAMGVAVTGIAALLIWYLITKRGWNRECSPKRCRQLQRGCVLAAFTAVGLIISLIIVNTTGLLQKWFGFTIESSYLLFDNWWGDSRGFNWKMTLYMFRELPLFQKFFGVGSDCYAFYAYSNPDYAEALTSFFGQNTMAANSHNEWLNSLLCHGMVGSVLYLGLFVSVLVKCFKPSDSKQMHPFVPAIGLCVLGYIAHNMFCYQQICATGPIFLLMGLAMHNMRTGGKKQNEF